MYQSEQINELAKALAKAQSQISPAIKDSTNPFFKSKYADLSSVWNSCKAPLSDNGLAVMQSLDYKDGQTFLVTTLAHESGQWVRSCIPINPTKNDAQGIGSAITYMRRYSLAALVGVTTDEDDDGNAACVATAQKASQSTISAIQARELQSLLEECSEEYQKQFWSFLSKEAKGIQKMEQLPFSMYPRIKAGIIKKKEENSSIEEEIYA